MVDRREVFLLKAGDRVHVMDDNLFHGEVKLRKQGSSDEFWTVIEAIRTD